MLRTCACTHKQQASSRYIWSSAPIRGPYFVSARTNKRHHHHRVQAGVLRMHNFKRFAHHSLCSRSGRHVARSGGDPGAKVGLAQLRSSRRRRSSVEAEAARRLRRSLPGSRQPLASASRMGTSLKLERLEKKSGEKKVKGAGNGSTGVRGH
jgi:hypothetical protein